MMYYVYVLNSLKDKNYYIGYSEDLNRRYKQHQLGEVRSTKHRRPLKLVCYEAYLTKNEALIREKYLKSSDGRKELNIRLRKSLKDIHSIR